MFIAFNKPYGVLSQFTPETGSKHRTLAEFGFPKGVYPIGRLDAESEGLLLLSDEPEWNERLLKPDNAHVRVYWAQVEGVPDAATLRNLGQGLVIGGRKTLPCRAYVLEPQPIENRAGNKAHRHDADTTIVIPPRDPPIRFRKNVPDTWIGLELIEGRNHQVRRMTAAVGHPTLRLIRVQIGGFSLGNLKPGERHVLSEAERSLLFERKI